MNAKPERLRNRLDMANDTCSEDDCDKKPHGRGLCPMHYARLRKTGSTAPPPERPDACSKCGLPRTPENSIIQKDGSKRCKPCREAYKASFVSETICTVPGCGRPQVAKGLCNRDYQRMEKKGNTDDPVRLTPEEAQAHRREVAARSYRKNRDRIRARSRARYWRNPATEHARYRRWRAANLEREAELNRAWREANPGRAAELYRQWVKANPERARQLSSEKTGRRRARKANTQVGPIDYEGILAEYGMVCNVCSRPIEDGEKWHWDHVIPLARGGAHRNENIRPAHAGCNQRKGAKLLTEYLARMQAV